MVCSTGCKEMDPPDKFTPFGAHSDEIQLIEGHFRIKDIDLHFMWLYHDLFYYGGTFYQNLVFLLFITKKSYLYHLLSRE